MDDPIFVQQDQLIFSWLLPSILHVILVSVTSCETTYQVWDFVQRVYSSDSKSRLLSLKQRLQQISKGNRSVSEYIAKVSELIEFLAIAGEKTVESDKVLYIISGLDEAFVQSARHEKET